MSNTFIAALKASCPEPLKRTLRSARTLSKRALRAAGFNVKECRVRNLNIKIAISSDTEQARADTYENKEPETLDWLDKHLSDSDVFMDIGANIGLYSLYAASLKPRSRIYAFEPESQNFSRLCLNLFLNGITNVVPCNFAIAASDTFNLFYVSEIEAGAADHAFGSLNNTLPQNFRTPLRQGVLSATLDSLVAKYALPQPTLVKIDVDGIEEDILRGAKGMLETRKLRSLLVEFNIPIEGPKKVDSVEVLQKMGYKLVWKGPFAERRGFCPQNHIFELTS